MHDPQKAPKTGTGAIGPGPKEREEMHNRPTDEPLVCPCGESRGLAIIPRYGCCHNCSPPARQHSRPVRCLVCGRFAPGQAHHVARKRYDPVTVVDLCLSCHQVISRLQDAWWAGLPDHYYLVRGWTELTAMARELGRQDAVIAARIAAEDAMERREEAMNRTRPEVHRMPHIDPLLCQLVALRLNGTNAEQLRAYYSAREQALQEGSPEPLLPFRWKSVRDLRLQDWPMDCGLDSIMLAEASLTTEELLQLDEWLSALGIACMSPLPCGDERSPVGEHLTPGRASERCPDAPHLPVCCGLIRRSGASSCASIQPSARPADTEDWS